MIRLRFILTVAIFLRVFCASLSAQELQGWEIDPLTDDGYVEYDYQTGIAEATNGINIYCQRLRTQGSRPWG